MFNPLLTNVPIGYPLQAPENSWFSGVFRGYKMKTLARNSLKNTTLRTLVIFEVDNKESRTTDVDLDFESNLTYCVKDKVATQTLENLENVAD